jgi:hypothetical protein
MSAAAAAAVVHGRRQQRGAESLTLEAGPDGVGRQEPRRLAHERGREADDPPVGLGHPAPARVGPDQVLGAAHPLRRVRSRTTLRAAARVHARALLESEERVVAERLGGGDVVVSHRPDLHRPTA